MLKSFFNYRWVFPVLTALFVFGMGADDSHAALTAILDFDQLATDIQPLLAAAIQAAAGVGAVVLAAMVCWRFFRRFIKG